LCGHILFDAVACAISRKIRHGQLSLHASGQLRGRNEKTGHTFSIALLVRTPLDPFFPLLPLRIDTLFGDAVLYAAKAGSSIIALFARLLTIRACVLDLPALGAKWLSWDETGREGVHVHRHAGVAYWVHSH